MTQKHQTTAVRQKQIIEAARRLIIKYGSEHVTVRRIAREVGFSEGAVYRHFRSKRDILSLLADHIEDSLLQDISASKAMGNGPLETLEKVLKNHISAIEQRRGISFQVIAEIISLGDKRLNRKISSTIQRYNGRLRELLSEAVNTGEVREDIDVEATAMLLFGMVQGLVNIWALSDYAFDPEEEYQRLWSVFKLALLAPRK